MSIEQAWYKKPSFILLLTPFSALFGLISALRRLLYSLGIKSSTRGKTPVIVVGNISVGGSGKTPVVIWLAQYLQNKGHKVGVVSRGYGGKAPHYPYLVNSNSSALESGDEPLLIYQRLNIPVVVSPNRVQAIKLLEEQGNIDFILSDDGLQHYAMARDIELVVIDGQRRFGNGWLMPVGPLREPISRLKSADILICNGGLAALNEVQMQLEPGLLVNIKTGEKRALQKNESVVALAGIGSPARFFATLSHMGANIVSQHAFKDHQAFTQSDFDGLLGSHPLIMTEKDAVKCASFVDERCWFLPVNALMAETLSTKLDACLLKLSTH